MDKLQVFVKQLVGICRFRGGEEVAGINRMVKGLRNRCRSSSETLTH